MKKFIEELNRLDKFAAKFNNGWMEFDPWRKEERFKTFLKKNYLPLTHWNK